VNTTEVPAGSIVVGIDGSPESDRALDWAARQAALEARPLTVLHAAHLGSTSLSTYAVPGPDIDRLLDYVRVAGRELLAQATKRVARTEPDVEVHPVLSTEDPRMALEHQAHRATTLVVGSRGRGAVASLLLGSVSVSVSHRAACPVVVVRSEAGAAPGRGVLVGVDGTDEPWSLDNERPAHVVDLPAYRIGRHPVTNAEWQRFVAAGGYDDPRWWSPRGWAHRQETGLERPLTWRPDGSRVRFGLVEEIPADEPVQHVDYFEAEAYAAWAGARLPTEQEWEKAATWDPVAGRRRRWPWGGSAWTPALANLDGTALRPAPVGAYPAGASAYGVEQMIGDVWEWTSSGFHPWPGFREMLYADYSAPFFGGDYRVLRGGSWAVGGSAIRPSFRNWDHPIRRQIFTGVRLAWDVAADV